jgi:hypothetical protein
LRFCRLGEWSLWADEIFTLRDAARIPASWPINPLPYVLVAGTVRAFGESAWSARLAPALAGTASVVALERVGRRLLGVWPARLGAVFTALLPWHVFWSQSARHYVFTFLFATLAVGSFFSAVETGGLRRAAAFWIWTALLILSHTLSAAMLAGVALYAVVARAWRRALPCLMPFVVAGTALMVIPDARAYVVAGWGHNVWGRDALYLGLTFAYGLSLPLGAAAVWGLVSGGRAGGEVGRRARTLLWCATLGPLCLFLVASFLQNVAGYYLFFLTPFLLLLAGEACGRTLAGGLPGQMWRSPGALAAVAIAAALVSGDVLYFTVEGGAREDWRGAMEQLARRTRPGDRVLMSYPEVGWFYLRASGPAVEKLGVDAIRDPGQLSSAGQRTFVVVEARSMTTLDPSGAFRRWLDTNGRRVARAPGYARGSDRTIEAFLLDDQASRKTESP